MTARQLRGARMTNHNGEFVIDTIKGIFVWISLNLKVNTSSQFFSVLTVPVWEQFLEVPGGSTVSTSRRKQ